MKTSRYLLAALLITVVSSFLFSHAATAQASGNLIEVKYTEGFENGLNGWYADNGVWESGIPSTGPDSASHGEHVVATILNGNYPAEAHSRLVSPTFIIPTAERLEHKRLYLQFSQWYSMSSRDRGTFEISVDGGDWEIIQAMRPSEGISQGWQKAASPDLSPYAGKQVRFGFNFEASDASTGAGWYLDHIEFILESPVPEQYESFESDSNWQIENGLWEIGNPTQGPASAYGGNRVAGTVLDGTYSDSGISRIISPTIIIPETTDQQQFMIRFWHWFSFAEGDYGDVSISVNDSAWVPISNPFTGEGSVWSKYVIPDLSTYAESGDQVRLAFSLNTTIQGPNKTGWYLDDVESAVVEKSGLAINPDSNDTALLFIPFKHTKSGSEWYADNGIWELGKVPGGSGTAFSDTSQTAGTVMHGHYPNGAGSRLISPPILVKGNTFSLVFDYRHDLSNGDTALVQMQVNRGDWQNISTPFEGSGGTWSTYVIADIHDNRGGATFDDLTGKEIRIGFLMQSKANGPTSNGWYLTNLRLGAQIPSIDLTTVSNEAALASGTAILHQNYPNPLRSTTTIAFDLPTSQQAALVVYDMLGREIQTLVDAFLPAGKHAFELDAGPLSSGMYIYRLKTDRQLLTRQMLLMR